MAPTLQLDIVMMHLVNNAGQCAYCVTIIQFAAPSSTNTRFYFAFSRYVGFRLLPVLVCSCQDAIKKPAATQIYVIFQIDEIIPTLQL